MSLPVAMPWDVSVFQQADLAWFIDPEQGEALIRLGAVYVNRKRCRTNRSVTTGDAVRVHLVPRRFFAEDLAWDKRILENGNDFVVVNKPSGIPVHPTCDNAEENLLAHLQTYLGCRLWVVHRLDIASSGLMILAKTLAFCRVFQKRLESGQIHKRYHCVTNRPVPLGTHTHFMGGETRAPFRARQQEEEGTKACSLEVLSSLPSQVGYWTNHLRLLTGKQHQIRAQLSTLGCPIVGDTLYGSKESFPEPTEKIALRSTSLEIGPSEKWTLQF